MQYSVYLHIPFCTHRCAYCDFNTYAGVGDLIPAYVDALCREVEIVGRAAPADCSVHTVFLGGGTPSLLSGKQVEWILETIRSCFPVEAGAEVTLEANPGTVNPLELIAMRRAGANRISLGAQSANGEELRQLERMHNFGDVLKSVAAARTAGFQNLNLDLIYGLPGQSLRTFGTTLQRILDLEPEHLSAYCLTLEHGTPFGRWAERGLLPVPDSDVAADMYELADREFRAAGYEQYEISNWARPGLQCRHNLQYWRGDPYLGFGAGAHGYAGGHRYANVLSIREYIARLAGNAIHPHGLAPSDASARSERDAKAGIFPMSPAAVERHRQSGDDDMAEFMMMGLRLTSEGVSENRFQLRFGRGISEIYGRVLAKLKGSGLIETIISAERKTSVAGPSDNASADRRIRLTGRGRLLGNRVFSEFVN